MLDFILFYYIYKFCEINYLSLSLSLCVWMLQRGHSGDGCVLASTLCKYDSRKGDLFVLRWSNQGESRNQTRDKETKRPTCCRFTGDDG